MNQTEQGDRTRAGLWVLLTVVSWLSFGVVSAFLGAVLLGKGGYLVGFLGLALCCRELARPFAPTPARAVEQGGRSDDP